MEITYVNHKRNYHASPDIDVVWWSASEPVPVDVRAGLGRIPPSGVSLCHLLHVCTVGACVQESEREGTTTLGKIEIRSS